MSAEHKDTTLEEILLGTLSPADEGLYIDQLYNEFVQEVTEGVRAYAQALVDVGLFKKSKRRKLGETHEEDLMEIDIPEGWVRQDDKSLFFSSKGHMYAAETAVIEGERVIVEDQVGTLQRLHDASEVVLCAQWAFATIKTAFDNGRKVTPASS